MPRSPRLIQGMSISQLARRLKLKDATVRLAFHNGVPFAQERRQIKVAKAKAAK